MNKHILLVMKWLNDKESVTQDELNDNRTSAAAAYAATAAAAAYATAAAATDAYADDDAAAVKWVTKYFEQTSENKQDYIDALTVKDAPPVFTQEMADNGVSATVGMEVKHQGIIKTVKCNSDINNCVVLLSVNGIYSISNTNQLEPITPPITLIDGECYQGTHKGNGKLYKGVYVKSTDEIFHCKCSNPASFYTNIQPLTVEVK